MNASEKSGLSRRLKQALQHAAALNLPLSVRLWDGSEVALGPAPIATVTIASPGVVAALLKRPGLDRLLQHYAVGNIAIEGADLVTIGTAVRASAKKKDMRALPKGKMLRLLWPFLFVRSAEARPRHAYGKEAEAHANARNQDYIKFHYDVGNDFYRLFLDEEMQYSCAYFTNEGNSLGQAQQDKLEMICRKLRLKPGERLLDIGCGWGGLICYAAQHYGVSAHGITLSQEQHRFAQKKIKRLGLEGKATVEIRDYQTLEGSYDKIASIGMFEHVGIANFPAYFRKANALLKDRGILLNHAIARRAKADKRRMFRLTPEKKLILKYIFPGSELAPIGVSVNAMESCGFEVHDVEAWREHYALTCAQWCKRLTANRAKATALVGEERYNLWVAYLAGVSLGFTSGSILIFQTVATKRAKDKGASGLPLTREDLYK